MILLYAVAVIVLIPVVLWLLSHLIYGRSFKASFVEFTLRHMPTGHGHKGTYEETIKDVESRRERGERKYAIPDDIVLAAPVIETEEDGMQVFRMNPDSDSDTILFYVHGGAFMKPINRYHWYMLNDIVRSTDVKIVIPLYGRMPFHDHRDTYPAIVDLYKRTADSDPGGRMVLAGDSSGGNIALVMAEFLRNDGFRQPDDIILLSPASGTSSPEVEEEVRRYERRCPTLGADACEALAVMWAAGLPVEDWRISPVRGDLSGLGRVTIFAGDRELLYPEAKDLYEKLIKAGNDAQLIVGRGMNHVYPVLPVPEAKVAKRKISEIILGRR